MFGKTHAIRRSQYKYLARSHWAPSMHAKSYVQYCALKLFERKYLSRSLCAENTVPEGRNYGGLGPKWGETRGGKIRWDKCELECCLNWRGKKGQRRMKCWHRLATNGAFLLESCYILLPHKWTHTICQCSLSNGRSFDKHCSLSEYPNVFYIFRFF